VWSLKIMDTTFLTDHSAIQHLVGDIAEDIFGEDISDCLDFKPTLRKIKSGSIRKKKGKNNTIISSDKLCITVSQYIHSPIACVGTMGLGTLGTKPNNHPGPIQGRVPGPVHHPCPDQASATPRKMLRTRHVPSPKGRSGSGRR
jgi:hypothetical protein